VQIVLLDVQHLSHTPRLVVLDVSKVCKSEMSARSCYSSEALKPTAFLQLPANRLGIGLIIHCADTQNILEETLDEAGEPLATSGSRRLPLPGGAIISFSMAMA
jgi:hypothetical protein